MSRNKLKPNRQGGTDYVRLADVPEEQLETLLSWLPASYLTKVNAKEQMLNDCIEYEDYEFWYEHCYLKDTNLYEDEI